MECVNLKIGKKLLEKLKQVEASSSISRHIDFGKIVFNIPKSWKIPRFTLEKSWKNIPRRISWNIPRFILKNHWNIIPRFSLGKFQERSWKILGAFHMEKFQYLILE
jgi:glutathione peroxidase-family protein